MSGANSKYYHMPVRMADIMFCRKDANELFEIFMLGLSNTAVLSESIYREVWKELYKYSDLKTGYM